jgi:hypothetical protein
MLYCVSALFGVGGIVKFALKALKRYLISSNIKLVLVKKGGKKILSYF